MPAKRMRGSDGCSRPAAGRVLARTAVDGSGRTKPDLTAFGPSGTSEAAALVSGAAAVLQQAFLEKNGTLPPAQTLRAVLLDLAGKKLPNTLVSFTSQFGLASFSPASATTDANGEATTVISPRQATTNGADAITATATVQGLPATAVTVLQFAGSTPTGTPTLDMVLSRTSISAASPAEVTVRLRDARGQGVAGQVVTFSVVRRLATTNVVTSLTNANGEAVVVLSPVSSVTAGADEVTATVSYAGSNLQRTVGFQVQATPVTSDGGWWSASMNRTGTAFVGNYSPHSHCRSCSSVAVRFDCN